MHAPICRPRPKGSIPYVRRRIDSLNLGAALEQTAAPVNRINRGYLQGQWQTLAGLAVYFSAMLSGIVVDRTGISGAFTLQWRPDPGEICTSCNLPLTVNEQLPDVFTALREQLGLLSNPDVSGTTIFTALQEQLGLKLGTSRGPVKVLVIDSVQKPSEN
jgi:uncharacterized protein (TIGR03435 family)